MEISKGLANLIERQFSEADDAQKVRLPRWATFLANWRGRFLETDEGQPNNTTLSRIADSFWSDSAGISYAQPKAGDRNWTFRNKLFVQETFRHTESTLARWDQAFTAPARPFDLTLPRYFIGTLPPTEAETAERTSSLAGTSEFLNADFKQRGSKENIVSMFRKVAILGTGFAYIREAQNKKPYPHATIDDLAAWRLWCDPYAPTSADWRYCFIEWLYSYEEALRLWPEALEELKKANSNPNQPLAAQSNPGLDTAPNTETKGETVRMWEYWGYLPDDLKVLDDASAVADIAERAAERPRVLTRLFLLANKDSHPTNIIVAKPATNVFSHGQIPVLDFSVLKSPAERGVFGIGYPDLLEDQQRISNVLTNLMILQQALATHQGGFVDASFSDYNQKLNRPFRPGELKPINSGGRPLRDVIELVQFPDVSASHLTLLQHFATLGARTTAVTDQNSGISTRTQSGTAAEAGLLQQESNIRFRFSAERLDSSFHRMLELYIGTTADALKGYWNIHVEPWLAAPPPGQPDIPYIWFRTDEGKWSFINPQAFDQPWEITVHAGGTFVDRRAQAEELKGLAMLGLQIGVPIMALEVFREACSLQGIDPSKWLPTQEQIAAASVLSQSPPGGAPPPGPAMPATPPGAQPAIMPRLMGALGGGR